MAQRKRLTAKEEAQLRKLVATPYRSWDFIASAMNMSRNWCIERSQRLGLKKAPSVPPPSVEEVDDPDRDSLPAGHPATWDLINVGTCLEGTPWPYGPVLHEFDRPQPATLRKAA